MMTVTLTAPAWQMYVLLGCLLITVLLLLIETVVTCYYKYKTAKLDKQLLKYREELVQKAVDEIIKGFSLPQQEKD